VAEQTDVIVITLQYFCEYIVSGELALDSDWTRAACGQIWRAAALPCPALPFRRHQADFRVLYGFVP